MSEKPCHYTLAEWDAILEECRKCELKSYADESWRRPDPSITEELKSICGEIFGHHFAPDAATYAAPFDRLAALIDDGLRFKEHRRHVWSVSLFYIVADNIHARLQTSCVYVF